MTRAVVISQPMLFPWVGLFEQIRLADAYVHYDDVQFSKGSFTNRVQIKTHYGIKWLTVPLRGLHLGCAIRETTADDRQNWRRRHLALLEQSYRAAPFRDEMLNLVRGVYAHQTARISDLWIESIHAVCRYFQLGEPSRFRCASAMGILGRSCQRVLAIVRALAGTIYVTGHGARHYLDHDLFERHGVRVEYMEYRRLPYPQLHGPFTPHVSVLDLIANCGKTGREFIASGTVSWQEFLRRECLKD